MAVPAPVLSVQGLGKTYGDARVLDAVDLEVGAGEVHALLGENGAGKSTLIKIVSGVVTHDEGTVTVGGQTLHRARYVSRYTACRSSARSRCSRRWGTPPPKGPATGPSG